MMGENLQSLVNSALSEALKLSHKKELLSAVETLTRCKNKIQSSDCYQCKIDNSSEESKEQKLVNALEARLNPLYIRLRSNPYIGLQLPLNSNLRCAKLKYKKLALRFHPDKSSGTREIFDIIQESFEKIRKSFESNVKTQQEKEGSIFSFFQNKTFKDCNIRLTVHSRQEESICLKWTPLKGIGVYELHWRAKGKEKWEASENVKSNPIFRKNNLKPGTPYEFKVRASAIDSSTGDQIYSKFSGTVLVVTLPLKAAVPEQPKCVKVLETSGSVNDDKDTFNINWCHNDDSHILGYVIQFKQAAKEEEKEWEELKIDGRSKSFSFQSPGNGSWIFRVKSKGKVFNSDWSDPFVFHSKSKSDKQDNGNQSKTEEKRPDNLDKEQVIRKIDSDKTEQTSGENVCSGLFWGNPDGEHYSDHLDLEEKQKKLYFNEGEDNCDEDIHKAHQDKYSVEEEHKDICYGEGKVEVLEARYEIREEYSIDIEEEYEEKHSAGVFEKDFSLEEKRIFRDNTEERNVPQVKGLFWG